MRLCLQFGIFVVSLHRIKPTRTNQRETRTNIEKRMKHLTLILCTLLCRCLYLPAATANDMPGGHPATHGIAATDSIPELPLPKVPAMLREPELRAAYIIEHFWEAMDFRNTSLSRNKDFLEQNFSNFISVFPYAGEQAQRTAIATLLNKAGADATAYKLLADVVEKYLYEPNSPMMSEEYYILFLEQLVKSPVLGASSTKRLRWQLETARKNRPGMTAADFAYTARNGSKTTLHKTASKGDMLLIFYDPDCDHCKEIMGELQADETLTGMAASGKIKVLAIYSGDDHDLWKSTAGSLPSGWTVGYEAGVLQENGSYVLRAMPTLYLLDRDKKVVLKDVLPAQLSQFLNNSAAASH